MNKSLFVVFLSLVFARNIFASAFFYKDDGVAYFAAPINQGTKETIVTGCGLEMLPIDVIPETCSGDEDQTCDRGYESTPQSGNPSPSSPRREPIPLNQAKS